MMPARSGQRTARSDGGVDCDPVLDLSSRRVTPLRRCHGRIRRSATGVPSAALRIKVQILSLACVLVWTVSLGSMTGLTHATEPPDTVKRVAQGVVLIRGYMGLEGDKPFVEASGYIIEDDSVISVNNVFTDVENRQLCERFRLRFIDGREADARVHSVDPVLNLILLKATDLSDGTWSESSANTLRSGDKVVALAGGGSLSRIPYTFGFVRARHKKSVYGAGLGDMFIDSHIRLPTHGDGGPLLNEQGAVIGINTPNIHRPASEASDPEEAHALPIQIARGFVKMSSEFPTAEQSWMGLAFRPLSPDEKRLAYGTLGISAGIFVDYVWSTGPGAKAGIAAGDVVVSVNGRVLKHLHELDRLLFELQPGNTAEIALLRQGTGFLRTMTLEERPRWAGYANWQLPQLGPADGEQRDAEPQP